MRKHGIRPSFRDMVPYPIMSEFEALKKNADLRHSHWNKRAIDLHVRIRAARKEPHAPGVKAILRHMEEWIMSEVFNVNP